MRTGLLSQPMKHDNRDEWKKKIKNTKQKKQPEEFQPYSVRHMMCNSWSCSLKKVILQMSGFYALLSFTL